MQPIIAVLGPLFSVEGATHVAGAQEPPRLTVSDTLWEVRLTAGEAYVRRIVAVDGDR